jgi:DNA helicase-2/ATP-dependent DNA helicase PcrA
MLHGQTRYNMRSRFFDELPDESLKWLSPKVQPTWFGQKQSAWDEVPMADVNQIAQNFSQTSAQQSWRVGQNVVHAKFGEGVIVNIEGSGMNARAHINFGKFGMKLLDLSIAKLEKI